MLPFGVREWCFFRDRRAADVAITSFQLLVFIGSGHHLGMQKSTGHFA